MSDKEIIDIILKTINFGIKTNVESIKLERHTCEVILEYIDELQKEIEEKTTMLYAGAEKVKKLEKENENLKEDYAFLQRKLKDDLLSEIEEQKKVIDLMAEHLLTHGAVFMKNYGCTTKKGWIEYFYEKVRKTNE